MVLANSYAITTISAETAILLDKEWTLLQIEANPNDFALFQTFFCANCNTFVAGGMILPDLKQAHPHHALAWLPAIDEPVPPNQALPVIQTWLATANLDRVRKADLAKIAPGCSSFGWGLRLDIDEREIWYDYFSSYLEQLADSWLAALNGIDTIYCKAEQVWLSTKPNLHFAWLPELVPVS